MGHRIDVRGTRVEVVRKDIKNLHVGVYPPSGRVRVAAPLRLMTTPYGWPSFHAWDGFAGNKQNSSNRIASRNESS